MTEAFLRCSVTFVRQFETGLAFERVILASPLKHSGGSTHKVRVYKLKLDFELELEQQFPVQLGF